MLKQNVPEGFVVLSFCVCMGLTVGTLATGGGFIDLSDMVASVWWIATCINAHSIISRLALPVRD